MSARSRTPERPAGTERGAGGPSSPGEYRAMSLEALQAFRRRVQIDSQLHQSLKRARAEATVAAGASAGFEFTVDEVLSSVEEATGEMSDEQLEAVAGGLLGMPFPLYEDPYPE